MRAALQTEWGFTSSHKRTSSLPSRGADLAGGASPGAGSVPASLPFPSVNVYLTGRSTLSISGLRHLGS